MEGDGPMFTPADEDIYESYIDDTEKYRELVKAQDNHNFMLKELVNNQKKLMDDIQNMQGYTLIDEVDI